MGITLNQWVSNVSVRRISLEVLLKHRLGWLGPNPRGSDSGGLRWGPRICISNTRWMFLVWEPYLENQWSKKYSKQINGNDNYVFYDLTKEEKVYLTGIAIA